LPASPPALTLQLQPMLMKRYVVIYGGTELSANVSELVEDIAYTLLEDPDIILVTGGFESAVTTTPGSISTDVSVLNGARRFVAANKGQLLEDRFQTWLPAAEEEQVKRFAEGQVIKRRGRSAQARRLALVNGADAILTVKGRMHTSMVLDLAFAIEKPALPLPFTGGDSLTYWNDNLDQIKKTFSISDEMADLLSNTSVAELAPYEKRALVSTIVAALQEGIQRRCLVLMDFDPEPSAFYESVVRPAIEDAGFKSIRIDKEANAGNILKTFLERLKDCDRIMADITEANPNVMYELGRAHEQNYKTILFSRRRMDEQAQQELPFYLQMESIENCDGASEEGRCFLAQRLKEHLKRRNQHRQ
jgi:hypothetical protein